jgi:aminoglycoside 6'-N-acetyltransferase
MQLVGDRVALRRLRPGDVQALVSIGRAPAFARWWPGLDEAELEKKAAGAGDAVCFAVLVDGAVVGLVQYYEEGDPDLRHAGIDIGLDPRVHGRGLGTDTVRALARYLVEERGHHRLVIDPDVENARAIRCYEKVGFRPVGVMRRYARGADGEWHDALLMDLLAAELS